MKYAVLITSKSRGRTTHVALGPFGSYGVAQHIAEECLGLVIPQFSKRIADTRDELDAALSSDGPAQRRARGLEPIHAARRA